MPDRIFKDLLRRTQQDINQRTNQSLSTRRAEQDVRQSQRGRNSGGYDDNIQQLADNERSRQFREEFDPRSGRFDEPYFVRRPDDRQRRIKRYDSRPVPVGSRIEDVQRLGRFLGSPRGALFVAQEQFRQKQNPQRRTRLFDPSSYFSSATGISQFADKNSRVTRHVDQTGSLIGRGLEAIGVGDILGGSSRYEDIVAEETGEQGGIPWGYFVSPAPRQSSSTDTRQFLPSTPSRKGILRRAAETIGGLAVGYQGQFGRARRAADVFATEQGVGKRGYLATVPYRVPQSSSSRRNDSPERRDAYTPERPYVQDIRFLNKAVQSSNPSQNPLGSRPLIFGAQEVYDGRRDVFTRSIALDRAFERARERRDETGGTFPYPDFESLKDGSRDRANDPGATRRNLFYENFIVDQSDDIPIHRRGGGSSVSYGSPNYSANKPTDVIQAVDIFSVDNDTEEYEVPDTGERVRDLIPFKIYDVVNGRVLVFRAFVTSISETVNSNFSQISYAGRPDSAYVYGGAETQLNFTVTLYPFSLTEFQIQWKKLNYLKGLNYPARYTDARGGGQFMTPPFLELTIGDMYNRTPGFMNSFSLTVDDNATWEINPESGRLPKYLQVTIGYTVIERRVPVTGQKFYEAPFLSQVSENRATDSLPPADTTIGEEQVERDQRTQQNNLQQIVDETTEAHRQASLQASREREGVAESDNRPGALGGRFGSL